MNLKGSIACLQIGWSDTDRNLLGQGSQILEKDIQMLHLYDEVAIKFTGEEKNNKVG